MEPSDSVWISEHGAKENPEMMIEIGLMTCPSCSMTKKPGADKNDLLDAIEKSTSGVAGIFTLVMGDGKKASWTKTIYEEPADDTETETESEAGNEDETETETETETEV